jgi:hypothetical protein
MNSVSAFPANGNSSHKCHSELRVAFIFKRSPDFALNMKPEWSRNGQTGNAKVSGMGPLQSLSSQSLSAGEIISIPTGGQHCVSFGGVLNVRSIY